MHPSEEGDEELKLRVDQESGDGCDRAILFR
jgi:hypothetical protein